MLTFVCFDHQTNQLLVDNTYIRFTFQNGQQIFCRTETGMVMLRNIYDVNNITEVFLDDHHHLEWGVASHSVGRIVPPGLWKPDFLPHTDYFIYFPRECRNQQLRRREMKNQHYLIYTKIERPAQKGYISFRVCPSCKQSHYSDGRMSQAVSQPVVMCPQCGHIACSFCWEYTTLILPKEMYVKTTKLCRCPNCWYYINGVLGGRWERGEVLGKEGSF